MQREPIKYLKDNGIPLVGAVHDFTCPQTGKNYMFFQLESYKQILDCREEVYISGAVVESYLINLQERRNADDNRICDLEYSSIIIYRNRIVEP